MVVPVACFLSASPVSMIDLQQQSAGAADSPVLFEPAQRKNRTGAKKQSIRNRNQQDRMFELLTALPAPGGANAAAAYTDLELWRRPEDALIDWSTIPAACDPCHHLDKTPARLPIAAGSLLSTGIAEAVAALSIVSAAAVSAHISEAAAPEATLIPQSSRGWLKRHQVDSFMILLRQLMTDPLRSYHIVDFGCGSGGLLLPLAALMPHCMFTGIDYKPAAVVIMRQRAAAAGLTNVRGVVGMIEGYEEHFDIGVALHACGNATDHALLQCVRIRAAYIANPCCVGKLKFSMAGGSSFSAVRKVFCGRVPSFIVGEDISPAQHQKTLPHTSASHNSHAASHPQPSSTTSPTASADPSPSNNISSSFTTASLVGVAGMPTTNGSNTKSSDSGSGKGGSTKRQACTITESPSSAEKDVAGSCAAIGLPLAHSSSSSTSEESPAGEAVSDSQQAHVIMQRVAAEGERRHSTSKPEKALLKKLMQYCGQLSTQNPSSSLPQPGSGVATAASDGDSSTSAANGSSQPASKGPSQQQESSIVGSLQLPVDSNSFVPQIVTSSGGDDQHVLQHPRSIWMRTHLPDPFVSFSVLAKVADTNHSAGMVSAVREKQQQQLLDQQQQLQQQEGIQDPDMQHADDSESVTSSNLLLSRTSSFSSQLTAGGNKLDPNIHSAHVTAICKLCKLHVEIDRNEAAREQGYLVALTRVLHDELQAKGDMLVGVPGEAPLWAHVHTFLT